MNKEKKISKMDDDCGGLKPFDPVKAPVKKTQVKKTPVKKAGTKKK